MVPFVVFSIVGHLADCVHKIAMSDFCWMDLMLAPVKCVLAIGAVGGNLPLWFLPSLLAVQLAYAFLHRKIRDEWICMLGFVVAYLTYSQGWHKPLYVGNIALGLVAYSMGHLLRDKQYERTILLVCLATYVVTFIIQPSFIDIRANELASGYYPLAVLFGISGCLLINNLFRRLPFRLGLLEYIGIRSMRYYVIHWIVLCVCGWTLNLSGWSLFGTMLVACIIVLPLIDNVISVFRLEWVFGKTH